ncbi:MAG: SH3 domain-containing protein [Acidaminococcaceae bacterium]|nr:SH3 domain-containing protein [Acidaminococcaceae bacterium]
MNPYEVLGVNSDCDEAQLKQAFMIKKREYQNMLRSKDAEAQNRATVAITELTEAYRIAKQNFVKNGKTETSLNVPLQKISTQESIHRNTDVNMSNDTLNLRESAKFSSSVYENTNQRNGSSQTQQERLVAKPVEERVIPVIDVRENSNYKVGIIILGIIIAVLIGYIVYIYTSPENVGIKQEKSLNSSVSVTEVLPNIIKDNSSSAIKTPLGRESSAYIIGTDVNVRTGASMQSDVVGSFYLGERVTVISHHGEWDKVRRSNGTECFVANKYLGSEEDLNRRIGKQKSAPNIPPNGIMAAYHSSADQEGNYIHSASLAIDGNINTCWSEGVKGNGIGENIEVHLKDTYKINGMNVWIGHQKSRELFYQNSRPLSLLVKGSDGSQESYYLSDIMGMQRIIFKYPITVNKMKLIVTSVSPGTKYEDTCIAEVNFF